MKNLISKKWLLARLYDENLFIVDCRFQLGKPDAGSQSYKEEHIPGALYMDLEKDLSGPIQKHGGRHPLPDMEALSQKLGQLGIDREATVVAYDDQGGAMASRLWWLLKYMGHQRVFIMEEGFSAWLNEDYPVSSASPPQSIKKSYIPTLQTEWISDMTAVQQATKSKSSILIDSREPNRYLGIEEPIDHTAGHIPTAVNYFWKDNINEHGKWKPETDLITRFQQVDQDHEIIVYCGSGVTACPNILALHEAGYDKVKLYAGSWSDWISYEDNPIARATPGK